MPFGVMVGPFVILWFISSWFVFDKQKFVSGLKKPWFLLMFAFLLLHCVSGLLSDNKAEGLSSIEVKLSFLAFPYFFYLFGISNSTVKRMVVAFVSACFFSLIFCLVHATYVYLTIGENEFFYNKFSILIHAGYFSMYMLFGILILVFAYPLWFTNDKWVSIIRYFFISSFLVGIFLCASKMGYIVALLILIIVPFIKFKDKLNIKTIAISLVLIVGVIFSALKFFPKPFERINNALTTVSSTNIDKTSSESTAVRLLIWDVSLDIIKENLLLGVGSGDANDVLQSKYREKGLTGALSHNLNTHNQFFQTTIALGLVGGLVLIFLTFGALVYGIIKKHILLILFSIIIILNFLVESMLQTQSGNLFFVGFLCILLTKDVLNLQEEQKAQISTPLRQMV